MTRNHIKTKSGFKHECESNRWLTDMQISQHKFASLEAKLLARSAANDFYDSFQNEWLEYKTRGSFGVLYKIKEKFENLERAMRALIDEDHTRSIPRIEDL